MWVSPGLPGGSRRERARRTLLDVLFALLLAGVAVLLLARLLALVVARGVLLVLLHDDVLERRVDVALLVGLCLAPREAVSPLPQTPVERVVEVEVRRRLGKPQRPRRRLLVGLGGDCSAGRAKGGGVGSRQHGGRKRDGTEAETTGPH